MVISVLMLGTASIALADSNSGDNGSGIIFTYSQQANGNLSGVMYGSTLLAHSVNATGYPLLSMTGTTSTKTMTIFNGIESGSLLLATGHASGIQSISTKANVTISFKLALNASLSGMGIQNLNIGDNPYGMSSSNWVVYQLDTPNLTGYLVSNGKVATSSVNNITFYSNTDAIMGAQLVAGFISRGNAETLLEKYSLDHHEDRFVYNSTTGNVTGSFLTFVLNKTDGNITNFTSVSSGTEIFSSINASGNGTLVPRNDLSAFRTSVTRVGGILVYSNGSKMYAIHDNPTLQSNFLVYNGTVSFTLGSSLSAKNFTTPSNDEQYNASMLGTSITYDENNSFGLNHEFQAGHNTIAISGTNFFGFLLISNANTTISGNTLTFTSLNNSIAKVSFLAPPGLQGINNTLQSRLHYAISHGKIASEISIYDVNSTISNLTMNLNASVNFSISSMNAGKVSFRIESLEHHGVNLAIFISNKVISNNVYVYLDGTQVNSSSYNGVINSTSDVNAYYTAVHESTGVLLIVHIPHFSNHTLVVSSAQVPQSGGLGSNDYVYAAIGGVVAVIAAIGAISIVKKRIK